MISKPIVAVYYVECSDINLPLDPIAIRPTFQNGRIIWEDTGRGTILTTDKVKIKTEEGEIPEKINLLTDKKQRVVLTEMTLDIYNEKVKHLAAGQPNFNSTNELQEYYLNTNFNYYGS